MRFTAWTSLTCSEDDRRSSAIAAETIGVVEEIGALPDARIVVDCDDRDIVEATGNGSIAWDETTFQHVIETDETLYLADDGSIPTPTTSSSQSILNARTRATAASISSRCSRRHWGGT